MNIAISCDYVGKNSGRSFEIESLRKLKAEQNYNRIKTKLKILRDYVVEDLSNNVKMLSLRL